MDSTEPTETPAVSEPETTEQNQEVVESEAAPPAAEADSKASAEATEPKAETEDKQEASAASEEPAAAGGDNSAAAASSKPEITPAAIVVENKTSGDKTEDNKEAGDVEKEPETKTNTEESKPKTGEYFCSDNSMLVVTKTYGCMSSNWKKLMLIVLATHY